MMPHWGAHQGITGRVCQGSHLPHEVNWLVPVAPHVDLFHPVGYALLLQLQHHLVAVGAPGSVVPGM